MHAEHACISAHSFERDLLFFAQLGQRFQILRTSGGVESTLLDIPAWDFHWQGSYVFKEPVQLLPTDNLTVRCTFENPGATTINWGEGTADEMCLANLQVVDQRP